MEEITMNGIPLLTSYGALGICTAYFMAKDWIKAKETDAVIKEFQEALKEFTAAALMCNRNGAVSK